jgi:hypothetical protein
VHEDVRPEQPDADEAPQLTDDVWQLAEQCWVKDPKARPDIKTVCDIISSSINGSAGLPPRHVSYRHIVITNSSSATCIFSLTCIFSAGRTASSTTFTLSTSAPAPNISLPPPYSSRSISSGVSDRGPHWDRALCRFLSRWPAYPLHI